MAGPDLSQHVPELARLLEQDDGAEARELVRGLVETLRLGAGGWPATDL